LERPWTIPALGGDRAGELDERGEATSPRPGDPLIKQLPRRFGGQPVVDLPELLH
jgi:hypothetical protein